MESKNIREGKLHGKSHPRQKHFTGFKDLPWLNLSGTGLEQAGFSVGQKIEITITEKKLVIKAL